MPTLIVSEPSPLAPLAQDRDRPLPPRHAVSPELIDSRSTGRAADAGLALNRPRHGGRDRLRASAVAFWLVGLALSTPILTSLHFPAEDAPAHLYWTSV